MTPKAAAVMTHLWLRLVKRQLWQLAKMWFKANSTDACSAHTQLQSQLNLRVWCRAADIEASDCKETHSGTVTYFAISKLFDDVS